MHWKYQSSKNCWNDFIWAWERMYIFLHSLCYLGCNSVTISIEIGTNFAYKYINHWYLKRDSVCVKFDTRTQTTI